MCCPRDEVAPDVSVSADDFRRRAIAQSQVIDCDVSMVRIAKYKLYSDPGATYSACAFYGTASGCRQGAACRFAHGEKRAAPAPAARAPAPAARAPASPPRARPPPGAAPLGPATLTPGGSVVPGK